MLALAHHLYRPTSIERGVVADRAAVARKLGLTRAGITQLLDLTLIAPDVQTRLLELEAVDGVEPPPQAPASGGRRGRNVAPAAGGVGEARDSRYEEAMSTALALFTIGYEGCKQDEYLALLRDSDVTLLCDVRRNPISRKKGFSKNTLAQGYAAVGIRYEHLPELGIASAKRQQLKTQADVDALFKEYEREWLPQQGEALAKICAWLAAGERVVLTCFEREPGQCHRHCVAEALGGFDVKQL